MQNKTILIRLPNWLGDMLMAFPFILYLKENNLGSSIHFIVKNGLENLLELLPFPYTHTVFDKAKYKGLSGLKSFASKINSTLQNNSNFQGQDLVTKNLLYSTYYCIPESFSSTLMAHYIKADKKIGFNAPLRFFLFDKRIDRTERIELNHRSLKYLSLFDVSQINRKDLKASVLFSNFTRIHEKINWPSDALFSNQPKEFQKLIKRKYAVLNINSEASSRRLPNLLWSELISKLPPGLPLFFIGSGREKEIVQSFIDDYSASQVKNQIQKFTLINLAGKSNLLELAYLIKNANFMISNDSGPAHLAILANTKALTFFGAGNDRITGPWPSTENSIVIRQKQKNLSCEPCVKNTCKNKKQFCLNLIETKQILDELNY